MHPSCAGREEAHWVAGRMNAGRTVRVEPAAARARGLSVFAIDAMAVCEIYEMYGIETIQVQSRQYCNNARQLQLSGRRKPACPPAEPRCNTKPGNVDPPMRAARRTFPVASQVPTGHSSITCQSGGRGGVCLLASGNISDTFICIVRHFHHQPPDIRFLLLYPSSVPLVNR